ncbi:MAG: hypothetical protein AAFQ38_12920 [Pseudomonadota bacterium]
MCVGVAAGLTKLLAGVGAKAGAGSILGNIATAATAASGVVGAYGMVQNARVAKQQAKYNAELQEGQARLALEQGKLQSDRQRRAGAAAQASQRAAMAANGIDVNSSDALDILDETRMFSEQDAFAIRENARMQAEGFNQGAANSINQGNADAASGRSGAYRTILGTAATIGNRYKHWVTDEAYA